MIQTTVCPAMAENIARRYGWLPMLAPEAALRHLASARPEEDRGGRYERHIRHITNIHNVLVENNVLNIRLHLNFLLSVFDKSVRQLGQTAARAAGMLQNQLPGQGGGRGVAVQTSPVLAGVPLAASPALPAFAIVHPQAGAPPAVNPAANRPAADARPEKGRATPAKYDDKPGAAGQATQRPVVPAAPPPAAQAPHPPSPPKQGQPPLAAGERGELQQPAPGPTAAPHVHQVQFKTMHGPNYTPAEAGASLPALAATILFRTPDQLAHRLRDAALPRRGEAPAASGTGRDEQRRYAPSVAGLAHPAAEGPGTGAQAPAGPAGAGQAAEAANGRALRPRPQARDTASPQAPALSQSVGRAQPPLTIVLPRPGRAEGTATRPGEPQAAQAAPHAARVNTVALPVRGTLREPGAKLHTAPASQPARRAALEKPPPARLQQEASAAGLPPVRLNLRPVAATANAEAAATPLGAAAEPIVSFSPPTAALRLPAAPPAGTVRESRRHGSAAAEAAPPVAAGQAAVPAPFPLPRGFAPQATVLKREAPPQEADKPPQQREETEYATDIVRTKTAAREVNQTVSLAGPDGTKAAVDGLQALDIDRNVRLIADRVYGELERRLRTERMRRGLL